jgi:hypothetical protein
LINLLNDCNGQVLPISKGNRGDSNQWSTLPGYKPDNTTLTGPGHHEWQPFTTWPKSWAGSYLTLVSSSTSMPRLTHRGWPEHYPIVHPWSEVRYHPTCRHTNLISLGIPYVLYASVHNSNLLTGARHSVLNQLMWGLPPWSSEYQIRPLSFLPIQYSPLSPNCPARSPIMPTIQSSC